MNKFRTAVVQYDTKLPDVEYNSRLAERLIRDSKANGADVVLFPECFLTSYSAPNVCEPDKNISSDASVAQDAVICKKPHLH